ncbi:MAG TPA: hypothetical protein VLA00_14695 [Xanthobacteraceae bacterium]|nr:hypothetical protein [Xanthobacteraceae bacterium]
MRPDLVIDPAAPIADGICFDDLHGLPGGAVAALAARGLVWLTSFRADGRCYFGAVIAATEAQAAQIADARGLGEVIDGQLMETVT